MIPNEQVLNISPFEEENTELNHIEMLKKFAKDNNITITDEYDLVSLGHIFLRSVDDLVICYIPASITSKQYEELLNYQTFFLKHQRFVANIFDPDYTTLNNYLDEVRSTSSILPYFYDIVKNICLEKGDPNEYRKVS